MSDIIPAHYLGGIRNYFDENGLTDVVGGPEALEEGLRQLKAGVLPVIAELVAAQAAGDDLSDAVFDTDHYPHLVRVHGFLNDILVMDLPSELLPWARKLTAFGPPPGAKALRKAAASQALRGADARAHLARFALFEALCLNQRLILMAQKGHLESINGRSSDIEVIAEREVDLALGWPAYGNDLARTDDPLKTLIAAAVVTLRNHVEQLKAELLSVRGEVHDKLVARSRILEVIDALPADQAVLVYNECAAAFDEDKLEAEDLRVHHPAMFGHISRDAIYQRVHRLPGKVEQLKLESVQQRRKPSLADLILGEPTPTTEGAL